MQLKSLIAQGTETISTSYPEREAREMVFLFLESLIGIRRHTHIVEPSYEVADSTAAEALAAFERMASGEPLQYVMGKAHFYGRDFRVTPDVLIPRPETEYLCRIILDVQMHLSRNGQYPLNILDLCTGSGCIAWTLALELPGARVTAADVSEGALKVAASQEFSAEMSRTGACEPEFVHADILNLPPGQFEGREGTFDIIVSNPPYVRLSERSLMRSNVLDHEPELALFVSDDDPLVFYRAVARWASLLLRQGGLCAVEINEALGKETATVFSEAGFEEVKVVQDLDSRDRFVISRKA